MSAKPAHWARWACCPSRCGPSMCRRCCTSCICCPTGATWLNPRCCRSRSRIGARRRSGRPAGADRTRSRRIGGAASRPRSSSSRSIFAASSSRARIASPRESTADVRRRHAVHRAERIAAAAAAAASVRRDGRGPAGSRRRAWWRWRARAYVVSTTRDDLANARAELAALHSANAELQRSRLGSHRDRQGSHGRARGDQRAQPPAAATRGVGAGCRARSRCLTAKYLSIAAAWTCCAIC